MDRYIVYGTTDCPFCIRARQLLESKNIEFVYLNMSEDPEGLLETKQFYDHYTVPIILKNHHDGVVEFVGGYDDLVELIHE